MPPLDPRAQHRQHKHAPPSQSGAEASAPVPLTASAAGAASPRSLPDRAVTPATLEDAYVRFILYCNPAVAAGQDTQALREAFRNPPRSAGKTFDTFDVYQLVLQFLRKEIKTWTELTIKLGVAPPDPKKDESAQKVTQYGVRLKKWMNSLHIKAFFDYLRGVDNDYWTNVPCSPDPTSQQVRDGVALEDDMALRALLPHIRPKRGRKRPDDPDALEPASQKMRLSLSAMGDGLGDAQLPGYVEGARSAHPGLGKNDGSQTPFAQWPASAVTPTVRGSFWDDALESQSATTPSQSKPGRQRRGAKNVSSAWAAGGSQGGGKSRGRPPMNRTPIEGPGFQFQPWVPSKPGSGLAASPITESSQETTGPYHGPALTTPAPGQTPHTHQEPPQVSMPVPATAVPQAPPSQPVRPPVRSYSDQPRPARPSISLKVPDRPGGPIRLATPPAPVVMVNGEEAPRSHDPASASESRTESGGQAAPGRASEPAAGGVKPDAEGQPMGAVGSIVANYYFERMGDRTNVDLLMEYFMHVAQEGIWLDQHGNPDEPATVAESTAIINATIETILREAKSTQTFLINLSALAGARVLKAKPTKCTRLADGPDVYNYKFEWEYQFGHFVGQVCMEQSVPKSMWRKPGSPGPVDRGTGAARGLSAEEWQRKYEILLQRVRKRDEEMSEGATTRGPGSPPPM